MALKDVSKGSIMLYERYFLIYGLSLTFFLLLLPMSHPPSYAWPMFIILPIIIFSLYFLLKVYDYTLPDRGYSPSAYKRFFSLTLFFLFISIFGALPYMASLHSPLLSSLFESFSATTTTSFTLLFAKGFSPRYMSLWRSYQAWQGALFYLLMISEALKPYWDPQHRFAERTVPIKFPFMSYKGTALSLTVVFFIVWTGVLALLYLPILGSEKALSLSLAISSTGGVSAYGNTLPDNPIIYFITTFGLILVSLNVWEVLQIRFKRKRVLRSLPESYIYLLILVGVILSYVLWEVIVGKNLSYNLFAVISASSGAGVYPIMWPKGLDDFTLYLLLILMFMGGCTFSLTSGFKVKRLRVLLRATYNDLLHAIHPDAYLPLERELGETDKGWYFFQSSIFIFFLYLVIILLGAVSLIISGYGITDGMFLTVSAVSNTGFDPTTAAGAINIFSLPQQVILIVLMFFGRMDIVIPLFLFNPSLRKFS